MDLVHVHVTAADLAGGDNIVVPHARTGLRQVLLVGDDVVLTDQDGEFHGATVVAVGGDGHDPEYHFKVGARLPVDMAAQRMTDADIEPEHADVHDVVDMLGELRDLLRQMGRG